ncbi:FAR1 domain-containing protein [Heracleum sosnowskyi]|uniref:FAR1 domain-containing protein n=1 Tax=Heracleum sosnowskyi TaxID=360622 RepID=A0AAD8HQ21_9APIA|nr:FAR1 domain-containing protein [Heracleum sosnowskyi]
MLNFDLNRPLEEERNEEPFIGQTFQSLDEAYIFYKNYAEANGFTVRKDRSATRHGKAIRRDFCCHRGGKKPLKPFHPSKSHRNRESSKCECNAHMRLTLKRSSDIFPEEWHLTKFISEHNHNLLSSTYMRLLPINRVITTEDEGQILLYKEAGLSVRQIIRVMELQKQVKHGELSFIERDVRNLFVKMKKVVGVNDAQRLIEDMNYAK